MYTGSDFTEASFSADGGRPCSKLDLFYSYMKIEDPGKFWKEADVRKKAKVVFFMFIFNFILLYQIFFGKLENEEAEPVGES